MDKTILHEHLRQYRHNNSDEFVAGYDYEGINQLFEKFGEAKDIIQYVIGEMIDTDPVPGVRIDHWIGKLRMAKSKLE